MGVFFSWIFHFACFDLSFTWSCLNYLFFFCAKCFPSDLHIVKEHSKTKKETYQNSLLHHPFPPLLPPTPTGLCHDPEEQVRPALFVPAPAANRSGHSGGGRPVGGQRRTGAGLLVERVARPVDDHPREQLAQKAQMGGD